MPGKIKDNVRLVTLPSDLPFLFEGNDSLQVPSDDWIREAVAPVVQRTDPEMPGLRSSGRSTARTSFTVVPARAGAGQEQPRGMLRTMPQRASVQLFLDGLRKLCKASRHQKAERVVVSCSMLHQCPRGSCAGGLLGAGDGE